MFQLLLFLLLQGRLVLHLNPEIRVLLQHTKIIHLLFHLILPVKQIKGSAGSLVSLIAYNDSNLVNFILIYDLLPINVSVGVSTPIAVIALKKTDVSQVPIHSVLFSNAISFVISGSFNGSIQPHGSGVYITALYDN